MFASCVRYHPVQVFGDACSKVARAQAVKRFYENELNGYAYLEVE